MFCHQVSIPRCSLLHCNQLLPKKSRKKRKQRLENNFINFYNYSIRKLKQQNCEHDELYLSTQAGENKNSLHILWTCACIYELNAVEYWIWNEYANWTEKKHAKKRWPENCHWTCNWVISFHFNQIKAKHFCLLIHNEFV